MKVKLVDVCTCESSNLKQSDVINISGKYPVYGATGKIGYIDTYKQEKTYIAIVKDGAGIGRTHLCDSKSSVIGTLQYILPKDNVLPEYLFYVIKHMHLEKYYSGATIPHIYFKNYKNEEFNLDSINKQETIIYILNDCNKLINLKETQLQKYDDLIKARFVEMFGDIHDNDSEFDVVTIEDVCSLIKDGTHQTPQYIENKEEGYKFLSSKDVMSQKIDWTNMKYIPAELHKKLYASIKPRRNDILMSKNGVNYGVAAVNDTDEVFDIYVSLALLRPKPIINPIFFRCVINNPGTKRQFDSNIKGIGVPNLHLREIKKTRIILPPMELQNEFVSFVQQVDKSKFIQMNSTI